MVLLLDCNYAGPMPSTLGDQGPVIAALVEALSNCNADKQALRQWRNAHE